MTKTLNININCYFKCYLWFTPYEDNNPDVIAAGATFDEPKASIGVNFDVEQPQKEQWLFYADISLSIKPYAKILTRSCFKVTCTEVILFTKEIMVPLMEAAIENAISGFNARCKAYNLKHDWDLPDLKTHAPAFADNVIKQYYNDHKPQFENNKLHKQEGLKLTMGNKTNLAVKATFMLVDEVLYENPAFNHKHNRSMFNTAMPMTMYYTLKLNCLKIDTEDIQMTWLNTVHFMLAMDCALQLLLGDHFDKLQPGIERKGLTPENQKAFISFATKMINDLNETLHTSGATIENLEVRRDWNAMML